MFQLIQSTYPHHFDIVRSQSSEKTILCHNMLGEYRCKYRSIHDLVLRHNNFSSCSRFLNVSIIYQNNYYYNNDTLNLNHGAVLWNRFVENNIYHKEYLHKTHPAFQFQDNLLSQYLSTFSYENEFHGHKSYCIRSIQTMMNIRHPL